MPFQARLFLVPLLLAVVVAACGAPAAPAVTLRLAPEAALSDPIRQAPPEVRDAYRFALSNRDTLQYIPCYCGCGADGHRSNYDCYIQEIQPDGTATFSDHAFT
jgi:hypothetical protein